MEVAYLEERTSLKVVTLATGGTRTVLPGELNYSYADGDQWFEWSPDGRSFAVQFLSPGRWSGEVGVVPASGTGKLVNVSNSGYEDGVPRWFGKGEILLWASDRHGARSHAGWGRENDVFAAFLTQKAWDRFRLDEAAYDQLTSIAIAARRALLGEVPPAEGRQAGAGTDASAQAGKTATGTATTIAAESRSHTRNELH